MNKLRFLAAIAAASLLPAIASAASVAINTAAHGGNSGGRSSSPETTIAPSIMPVDQFARVLVYPNVRNWYTEDGRVLICPFEFVAEDGRPKKCYAKGDKTEANRWTYFEGYKHLPGFEVSGVSYIVGRYDRQLVVYFRKEGAKP